ncbi:zf-RVT domain-containing protein [Cephalotus follicularis]|uniref:Zf-RVT domain-containing protein n=1 Tax=Cephalotus follicularis TaxID=3775 RepID=A0A1Q3B5Y4_CEPFO|nr:zf-RVT domain-containing protein [Cephalotus follicularis]
MQNPRQNIKKKLSYRACRRALPTGDNLQRRGMQMVSRCKICKNDNESIDHVLLHCPEVQLVWNARDFGKFVQADQQHSFADVVAAIHEEKTANDLALFLIMAWWVLFNRNEIFFHGSQSSMPQTVSFNVKYQEEYMSAMGEGTTASSHHLTRWCTPIKRMVKINCDGATFKEENCSGWGTVFRTHEGVVIGAGAGKVEPLMASTVMEAMEIFKGMSRAKELGLTNIVTESDPVVLITAILSRNSNHVFCGSVIADIVSLIVDFF